MHCSRCGMDVPDTAGMCPRCGRAAGGGNADLAVATLDPPHLARGGRAVAAAPRGRYAGFLRRVAAAMLDGVIYTLLLVPLIVVFGVLAGPWLSQGTEPSPGIVLLYYAASWALGWLYYASQHASRHQATFGKRALRIKVVTLDGRRLTFAHASGRYLAYLVAGFTFGIGYVIAAFTRRRQALHDMMAKTLVVSRETTAGDLADGLGAPKASPALVAVAVAAGLVPLAGIVAAISIPAYQAYLGRGQIVDGLESATPIQARIEEAYAAGTPLEEIDSETLGLDAATTASPYVSALEVVSGAIVITYGGAAGAPVAGGQLVLVPGHTGSGEVVWTCGLAEVPDGVTPSVRAHTQYTSFDPGQLPARCR